MGLAVLLVVAAVGAALEALMAAAKAVHWWLTGL